MNVTGDITNQTILRRAFRTALITGIQGSGGSYLADYIAEQHPTVKLHGLARWHSQTRPNLEGPGRIAVVHECDLTDMGSVLRVLQVVRPDVIFHLASHANVRASFEVPLSVMQNNLMATANLLEAVRVLHQEPVIQLCSTSEVYGMVRPEDVPITEECPLRPVSPYAVSKTAQDLLGFSYFKSFGLAVIRTRMFAYFNPRRPDLFATSFARQVARIELGLQDELKHGNLDSTRTMIDVRDAMNSYWVAAESCAAGEAYNIGGKTVISVGELLQALTKMATKPIPLKLDPGLLRPADVTLQIPDTRKFIETTGWEPRYSFAESMEHLLEYWRRRSREEFKGSAILSE